MASVGAAASKAARICFNSHCKEAKPEAAPVRKGWRLRSGEYADLCDRCCGNYEQGTFCETFHSDDAGWRNCESCRKRVHCGCIVSNQAYLLLDAGGVECIACVRKALVSAPNQMRPSPSFLPLQQASERPKDLPTKSWNQMSSYPGQWRQMPKIWNLSNQTELQRRISYEFDRPSSSEKLISGVRPSICVPEKKADDLSERMAFSSLSHHVVRDRYVNGNNGLDSVSAFNTYHQDERNVDGTPDSGHPRGETDPLSVRKGAMPPPSSVSSSGVNFEVYPGSSVSTPVPPVYVKDESPSPMVGLSAPYPLSRDSNDQSRLLANQPAGQTTQSMGKQLFLTPNNVNDSNADSNFQMRNGRPKVDSRGRNHLLSRYCPRITSEELQQISGDSNSVITPLFEKILSASDAGRIGRLVLPKKCAEAYFPPISQPEGLPLKVQDATGKEWVFQFRFWPNNNSRMYVLEGVTPCIQSMQLLAGDIVTFSRIDPEGRLVMGFRKASSISTEQENQPNRNGNSFATPSDANNRNNAIETIANTSMRPSKGATEPKISINAEDQANQSNFDKVGFIQKDGPGSKASPGPSKRKGSALGSKSKRLRIENEDSIELKLTWEEAQELLRPSANPASNVVVIDGHEIEEFEEAPVIGKPTFFSTDLSGEIRQWAQCENCSKWRKLPANALLPFRWTCSDNKWDQERASCASPQELSKEEFAALLPTNNGVSKKSKTKVENETVEVSDGLDTLANLAILGEGEALPSSSQATTKHPRHRPGCTCIVCIQPPSGKGPKHQQTCTCNVCLTVKRRFRTLMLRRERRQSEKEAEKKQQLIQSSGMLPQVVDQTMPANNNLPSATATPEKLVNEDVTLEEESEQKPVMTAAAASLSPVKATIDLNIQPEREEEPSQPRDLTDIPNSRGWLPRTDTEGEAAE
ncbi:B3 domain-containing protein Os07g0563300-like [Dioscorea cayenensis subsp. rotundata]|uniref:B3 domain-containing protein Os07g0563300-like n=1 Tax=Dioscorea cayennensis subsp. rotundata TaxID=55577 RepID=A0AB40AJA3_DIOCR|nr:B3 domain-containing protein Os07g0563300-like [Dioscorea cayenensis subsp. rotundata]